MKKTTRKTRTAAKARSSRAACSAILDDWQSITMHRNPTNPADYEVHIHGGVLIIGHGRTLAAAVRDAHSGYTDWKKGK